MKVEEVDAFLGRLAEEFHVAKPSFEIWEVKLLKRGCPQWFSQGRGTIQFRTKPFEWGACFKVLTPKFGRIVLLTSPKHIVSKRNVVHEMMHYFHFEKRGDKTEAEIFTPEEEKITKKQTRAYLKAERSLLEEMAILEGKARITLGKEESEEEGGA